MDAGLSQKPEPWDRGNRCVTTATGQNAGEGCVLASGGGYIDLALDGLDLPLSHVRNSALRRAITKLAKRLATLRGEAGLRSAHLDRDDVGLRGRSRVIDAWRASVSLRRRALVELAEIVGDPKTVAARTVTEDRRRVAGRARVEPASGSVVLNAGSGLHPEFRGCVVPLRRGHHHRERGEQRDHRHGHDQQAMATQRVPIGHAPRRRVKSPAQVPFSTTPTGFSTIRTSPKPDRRL